jgi:hypothetical protein
MTKVLIFGAFLSIVLAAAEPDLQACGDKFLFVGRIVKYQQTVAASSPASILIYMNPASKLPAAVQETKLDSLLSMAGHRVEAVGDSEAVARAVRTGRYDVLLVDAADAPHADLWKAAAPSLVVVPVLYHATKAEQVAAEQTYKRILKAPAKPTDSLALVNEIMKGRPKARVSQTS